MFRTGISDVCDVSPMTFFFSTDGSPENDQLRRVHLYFRHVRADASTMLISVPLSVIIAVFLAEMTPTWLRNILRPVLDLLVGIPSVVYGFLGLTILIPLLKGLLRERIWETEFLAAAIVLTIMVLPTISRISDDAICVVPQEISRCLLCARRDEIPNVFKVVLPAAKSGIMYARYSWDGPRDRRNDGRRYGHRKYAATGERSVQANFGTDKQYRHANRERTV